ncbi:uncharacterized protein LOC117650445 [Thrips palmi]|uniref:Uncharacterized protein LOC117650445 n=1 Tax=Thrips palmi TaxID=161013 RepID=A0A6P8ZY65_THRPL|nr:uncharacterized protein LOC117650445 [Thrips palmi]
MTLRMAMAVLLAMALLEGALARPHSPDPEQNQLPPIRHHKQHHRHGAHGLHGRHHIELERRQLCGRNLSEALRLLCAGRGYYSPDSASGSSSRHGDTGVATECCSQGCSQQELELYCQPRKNAAPLALSDSSPETTEDPDSASLDSAHQANHIRHSMEAAGSADNKPTVVGGKVSSDMAAMHFNVSEMIKVGTIPQQHFIPVRIPLRHKSNSLQ